jgi:hypothetical protein
VHIPLAPLRGLRREPILGDGQHQLGRELHGVHELVLRRPGMHREAADRHAYGRGRERLDLQLAEVGAVEGVGDVCTERLEVEALGPATNLLVDREGDADRRPRPLGMRSEIRDCGDDLRVVPSLVTMS